MQKRYIKSGDIGAMLKVRGAIIRRWAREGKIPSVKLPNGRFLFDPKAVQNALAQGKVSRLSGFNVPVPVEGGQG